MNRKIRILQPLVRRYVRRRLASNFADVRAMGVETLERALAEGPFVLALNHVCWWDPLVLYHLDASLKGDGFALMDKSNLDDLSFFRALGAVPLDRSSTRSSRASLAQAIGLLNGPRRYIAIFPAGEQRPPHLALDYAGGAAWLAASVGVPTVPLALRYDFASAPNALVHLVIGAPLAPPLQTPRARQDFSAHLETATREGLNAIDRELLRAEKKTHQSDQEQFRSLLGRTDATLVQARLPWGARLLRRLGPTTAEGEP